MILLDELLIMKCIEYKNILDEIEDLGKLVKTDKLRSDALIFMIRGLYKKLKFPLAYFFTGSQ